MKPKPTRPTRQQLLDFQRQAVATVRAASDASVAASSAGVLADDIQTIKDRLDNAAIP